MDQSKTYSRDWIIIADQHLKNNETDKSSFLHFLSFVNWSEYNLILLGDVFDIWTLRYSQMAEQQIKILTELNRIRKVYSTHIVFCQGNRDLFLPRPGSKNEQRLPFDDIVTRGKYYPLGTDTVLFAVHGDLINTNDKNHIRLHYILSSSLVGVFFGNLPKSIIQKLIRRVEMQLKRINVSFKSSFTQKIYEVFLSGLRNNFRISSSKKIISICGHFHPPNLVTVKLPEITGYILKPWFIDKTYYVMDQKGKLTEKTAD